MCLVNFQFRGVLHIWIRVGKGPTALTVGVGRDCLNIFSIVYHFGFFAPSLWETARYRLKYCLKEPLSPKQPTNQQNRRKEHYGVKKSGKPYKKGDLLILLVKDTPVGELRKFYKEWSGPWRVVTVIQILTTESSM